MYTASALSCVPESAPTVHIMKTSKREHTFSALNLGDILQTPTGTASTVRSVAEVNENQENISSLCLLGDMTMLLVCYADDNSSISMLVPVQSLPIGAQGARCIANGAALFWPAHLPAISSALGSLEYSVMLPAGAANVYVQIRRGAEIVFFSNPVRLETSLFTVSSLEESLCAQMQVARYAAVVNESHVVDVPILFPAKTKTSIARK